LFPFIPTYQRNKNGLEEDHEHEHDHGHDEHHTPTSAEEVLEFLFEEYSAEETLSLPQLEALLGDLGLSMAVDDHDHEHDHKREMIEQLGQLAARGDLDERHSHGHEEEEEESQFIPMEAEEMMTVYNLSSGEPLSKEDFTLMSPLVLLQLVQKAHFVPETVPAPEVRSAHVWGFSFLATFLVSVASLIGFPFYKIIKKPVVMNGMIGLGIGTLVGDSVLHLLPSAFGVHSHGDSESEKSHFFVLYVGLTVLLGIYVMFLADKISEMFFGRQHHNHSDSSSSSSHEESEKKDTEMKGSGDIPSSQPASQPSAEDHASKDESQKKPKAKQSLRDVKLVGWMILINDGFHNLVDGLAIGASFSVSLTLGWATTLAVLLHELPHEIGSPLSLFFSPFPCPPLNTVGSPNLADLAILIHSGFKLSWALGANFISALTAVLGSFIGAGVGLTVSEAQGYILATTAGAFLYISLYHLVLLPSSFPFQSMCHFKLCFLPFFSYQALRDCHEQQDVFFDREWRNSSGFSLDGLDFYFRRRPSFYWLIRLIIRNK